MTPTETLAVAQQLLERADPRTAGLWPRAAALLARQALEETLDAFWLARNFPLEGMPTRPQLICLGHYLKDEAQAAALRHTWNALSGACHHHPYEVAPTVEELSGWIGTVSAFVRTAS
jgi:hypothetical protein